MAADSYYNWGPRQAVASSRLNSPYDTSGNLIAPITTDTISEKTAGEGVTIDGVLMKDGNVFAQLVSGSSFYSTNFVYSSGVQNILTVPPSSVYLVSWEGYGSGADRRWATALVQNVGNLKLVITTLSVGSDLGAGTTPYFDSNGVTLQFYGGSGSPNGNIRMIRLA